MPRQPRPLTIVPDFVDAPSPHPDLWAKVWDRLLRDPDADDVLLPSDASLPDRAHAAVAATNRRATHDDEAVMKEYHPAHTAQRAPAPASDSKPKAEM
jgi:hypothetical protein